MAKGMPEGLRTAMFWAIGIGIIALVLLILLIIFGNLSGSIGFGQTASTFTNETINLTTAGDTPATAENRINPTLSDIIMTNESTGEVITAGNYTLTGVIFINSSADYGGQNVNVSATVTYDEQGKIDTDNVISNYSASATNISEQFPTVGTIVGIAILLVVLIGILAFAISKMMGVAENSAGASGSFERGANGGFG